MSVLQPNTSSAAESASELWRIRAPLCGSRFHHCPPWVGRLAGTYKATQLTSPRTLWPCALVSHRANVPEVAGREGAPSLIPRHTYALQCFRSDWAPHWASCGRPESTLVQTWRHQLLARGRPAMWLQDLHGTQLCHMVWLMANAADLTQSYPIREDSGCMEAGVNLLPEHTSIQGCMLAKYFVIFQPPLSTVPLRLPYHQPAVCQ